MSVVHPCRVQDMSGLTATGIGVAAGMSGFRAVGIVHPTPERTGPTGIGTVMTTAGTTMKATGIVKTMATIIGITATTIVTMTVITIGTEER